MSSKRRDVSSESGLERYPLQFTLEGEDSDDNVENKAPPPPATPPPIFRHIRDTHPPPSYAHIIVNKFLLRYFPRLIFILVICTFIVALLPGGWRVALCAANILPFPEFYKHENVTIIGHRGSEFPYPPNSLQALVAAVNVTDFVEVDIALTSDGEVILMHDIAYNKTTNGTGLTCMASSNYVKSLVLKIPDRNPQGQLAHGKFCTKRRHAGGLGTVPCTYRVPTLDSVFDELPDTTRYMLDVKACYAPGISVSAALCSNCTRLMEQVKKLMLDHFINPKRVVFTSTEQASLAVFRDSMGPNSTYSISAGPSYSHYKASTFIKLLDDQKFDAVSMHVGLAAVRPDLVYAVRNSFVPGSTSQRRQVYVWTIRRDVDYKLARCAGASTLIAAEPKRLKRRMLWKDTGSLLAEAT